jgi:hypothetical protein
MSADAGVEEVSGGNIRRATITPTPGGLMSKQSAFAVVFVSVILVVAAACGGDDDRLSRDEVIEQGDAICADYEARIDAVGEPTNANDIERYVDEVKPIVEEGTNELDNLTPPEDLEDEYDEWIALTRRGVGSLDELKAAAAAGDEQRIQEIVQGLDDEEAEADRIAQGIGFQECGAES